MKHLLNEFFDLSNLLQILNDHRMVDVELFGNLVFLPGESRGQRNLVDYSPQGRTESDMTEAT